jgi:large subunit ribosomal protein L30e
MKDLKKYLKSEKLVLGTQRVLKNLKTSKLQKVFVSANCPSNVLEDLHKYSKVSKTELVKLDVPNNELGVLCKKPFAVSVIGLLK